MFSGKEKAAYEKMSKVLGLNDSNPNVIEARKKLVEEAGLIGCILDMKLDEMLTEATIQVLQQDGQKAAVAMLRLHMLFLEDMITSTRKADMIENTLRAELRGNNIVEP